MTGTHSLDGWEGTDVGDRQRQSVVTLDTEHGVTRVAFSPNGRQVLTGLAWSTLGGVQLWEAVSGELLATFEGHGHIRCVMSVAFSPNGKQVLIGSVDGVLRLWETESGKLHSTLQDPIYSETGAVYSLSGTTYVASNSVTCMALDSHGGGALRFRRWCSAAVGGR